MPHGTQTISDGQHLMTLARVGMLRDLTADEERLVDECLARHGGDPVAALNAGHLSADRQAELRRLPI